MKSVLLKFTNTKKILYSYIIYFAIFIATGYFLSKTNGLIGFTVANIISRIILWILFIILLIQSKVVEKKDVKKDKSKD